jgi:HEPN domain-containing protein
MMTKEEHIKYWVDTAQKDWKAAECMFDTKNYMHCLVWAHLVLEKLSKAHWVRTHEDNIPPIVHNVVWLLEESEMNFNLDEETMTFLREFNDFQLEGRYPDYTQKIYRRCTKDYARRKPEKIKEVRTCLLKML